MNTPHIHRSLFRVLVVLLLVSPNSHAQIYKCVDQNGRTHYSEKKDDTCKSQAVKVDVRTQAGPTQAAASSAEHWQEQERLRKQRSIEEEYRNRPVLSVRFRLPPNPSTSNPSSGGADDSKCRLARDVLSGAVRHSNGAKTDDNDRRVAQRDVEKYCR